MRLGWDPIVGLVPGIGDALTSLFSALVLFQAFQMRIPRIIQLRMLLNVLIDMAVGFVPVVGDVFDFAWKSNQMNFRLLERHASKPTAPRIGDWVFVIAILGLLAASVLAPLLATAWALRMLGLWL